MVAEDRDSTAVPVTKVVKDRANVEIVATITHLGNALPMERNVSDARSPTTSRSSAEVTHRTGHRVEEVVVGKHIDMHEVDKEDDPFAMYEYDAINVRNVCFTTNVKYTHNANIAFDEVSSDRKLQCLLTDVTVSNKIGNKTTVCVKLDTGASSNLLPYNVFKEIFPHVHVTNKWATGNLSPMSSSQP